MSEIHNLPLNISSKFLYKDFTFFWIENYMRMTALLQKIHVFIQQNKIQHSKTWAVKIGRIQA